MSIREDKLYWNKKDGNRILIKDMTDEYLLQQLKNLETTARETHGKTWKTKVDPKYHILKLHALGRDLIKK